MDAIPYVQVNFVFGIEGEPIAESLDLTAQFVRAVPGAWPTFNLITAWGTSSPLSRRLHAEGRILPVPLPLLDQKSCSNVIGPPGATVELYRGLIRLEEEAFGAGLSWQRARRARRWGTRFINFVRGRGAEMRERIEWHRQMLYRLEHDRGFEAFFEGETVPVPLALRERALSATRPFVEMLPREIADEISVEALDADPYPIYRRLRQEAPVAFVPAVNLWLATRWAECEEMARLPEVFVAESPASPVDRTMGRPNILTSDGPVHQELRRSIEPKYRAKPVAEYLERLSRSPSKPSST